MKGNSVVEFGKSANSGASFLGVGLMSEYLYLTAIISENLDNFILLRNQLYDNSELFLKPKIESQVM